MLSKKVITKATLFLNEVNNSIINKDYNTKNLKAIAKITGCNYNIFYSAVYNEYFTKIDRGIYKSNYKTIEPLHARKSLDHFYSRNYKAQARKRAIKKMVNETKKEPLKIKSNTMNKSFSILWGFIKFNY